MQLRDLKTPLNALKKFPPPPNKKKKKNNNKSAQAAPKDFSLGGPPGDAGEPGDCGEPGSGPLGAPSLEFRVLGV